MGKYTVTEESLTAVADAIRSRAGTEDALVFPDGFVSAVEELVNPEYYIASVLNKTVAEIVTDKEISLVETYFQRDNPNLTKVSLPNALALGGQTFQNCPNLVNVNLPKVVTMAAGNFQLCASIVSIRFPSLTTITEWGYGFNGCSNLEKVNFPVLTSAIGNREFNGCTKLSVLILGANSVCTLSNTSAFAGTPIESGTGYVYVPRSLVDSYKSATNWSAFASQIRAIEDYPEVLEGWE